MTISAVSYNDLVQERMVRVERLMRSNPSAHHPSLDASLEQLLSSGGKRIRPTVVLLVGGMLEAETSKTELLAAAIEMLHTATLVHDDLIDSSPLRRGLPTLNTQWNDGLTVLIGDYIFARAAHLAARTDSLAVMDGFAKTLMTIVNGEVNQLIGGSTDERQTEYLERVYAKTGSLFELAGEGAAHLANTENQIVERMKTFGRYLGIAFQIVDDVLDFTAEAVHLGKPVANDLRQGLITLPTIKFLDIRPERGSDIKRLINRTLSVEATEELIQEIRESGAIPQAMGEARSYIHQCVDILSTFPDQIEKQALCELAQHVIDRTQ
jgi:geranylgeranyl pyrophosphate synthase